MADFQGIIVIHKEKGFTSHDVVAKLRGILHMKKIGHTGTLDPDATGVLPVALGKGTKLVDLLTDKEKTYEAVLHLGIDTDTQDMSGTVLEERPVNVTEEEVRKVLKSFVGVQSIISHTSFQYATSSYSIRSTGDRKSTRLNSSHMSESRMPSSA